MQDSLVATFTGLCLLILVQDSVSPGSTTKPKQKGLPDLVPDLGELLTTVHVNDVKLKHLACALDEGCLSSSAAHIKNTQPGWRDHKRKLLRFSTVVHNAGDADFRPPVAKEDWQWHECHKHFHSMEVFSHYDIVDDFGKKVAEGSKASFCLEDTACVTGKLPRYRCHGYRDQGLSPNCSDTYAWTVDCQWIDITDMRPGMYTFLVEINPNKLVPEESFWNNVAACRLFFSGQFATLSRCRLRGLKDVYKHVV